MKINERNLCTFACTDPVDLNGFLNKRGEVNKAWQRRWFVLKGNLLFYFEKRGDKEPLGVIILEGCTIELAEDGEQYCFKIIFHGEKDRSYLLAAETQDLMEKWMKALTCAGYEYMKLMVAELQRQLEELEESQGKVVAQENGQVTGNRTGGSVGEEYGITADQHPKAPPRRHNPFNRPQGAGGGAGLGNGGGGADDVTIRQKDYSIQRQGMLRSCTICLIGKGSFLYLFIC